AVLGSRDNPKVKRWRKLAADPRYRRAEKRALIEGPHLLAAALERGIRPIAVLVTEEAAAKAEIAALLGAKPVLLAKGVFGTIVDADTPQGIAAEIAIPSGRRDGSTIFLEGVQDPANVGAILRSAAGFGVARVVLDRGCADPWSPKALRAGMGGHFGLGIEETADLASEIEAFKGTVACTVPRGGIALHAAPLERSMAWLFRAEGRGLSDEIIHRADLRISIPMAMGTESLNVAAAAAICLYQSFSRSAAGS
ncbi:MAG TPA: RNA methyltransferase, partial [Burkholderiales bacterium]|nr:RNA methyltransferase [Burkholderiales bacterium]